MEDKNRYAWDDRRTSSRRAENKDGSCRSCSRCAGLGGNGRGCGCGASRRDEVEPRGRKALDGYSTSCRDEAEARERNAYCGCGASNVGHECGALMNQLQKLDFSIQETVLYLNAHPDCKQALEHYRALVKERCVLAAQYEKSCGGLTTHGNGEREKWGWVDGAWPWHPDFPGNRTW